MHIDELLKNFEAVEPDHDGYLMRCPAHNDGAPSLKLIVHENRKVGITCRRGCANSAVVKAAGLTWAAFFDVTGETNLQSSERAVPVSGAPVLLLRRYLERLAYLDTPAAGYAQRRFGISPKQGAEIGLGFDHNGGFQFTSYSFERFPRLIVPMRDFEGVARGLQGRDLSGQCPGRWLSLANPEGQHWARYGVFPGPVRPKSIVLTEGPGDALAVRSAGVSSVLVRGAQLARVPGLAAEIVAGAGERRIVIAGDNDTAGDLFVKGIASALIGAGAQEVHRMVVPDLGDKSDVALWQETRPETFADELRDALSKAKKLRWDGELKHDPARVQQWRADKYASLTKERVVWTPS
ncbi:toprim domain-containing protein [Streptomyces ovatisporus]|uniref:Toprim domain-containing protein n=1 Tax=Streptomyces ovatisporus TaxID=1128682 RepID=A0ABV9A4X8_9ACTN